jgi:hypothetical protein
MLDKIKKDIWERSKVKNLGYFPQTGESQEEFDYRYCTSNLEGLDGYYFVVSKFLKFQGNSMHDGGFKVYVYDKEGNFVTDPKINEKCRGQFFETIKDIE